MCSDLIFNFKYFRFCQLKTEIKTFDQNLASEFQLINTFLNHYLIAINFNCLNVKLKLKNFA